MLVQIGFKKIFFLTRCILKGLGTIELREFLQIIMLSIAISTVLIGFSIFNVKGSCDVSVKDCGSGESHIYASDILDYYEDNKITMPAILKVYLLKNKEKDDLVGTFDNVPKYFGEKRVQVNKTIPFRPYVENPKVLEDTLTSSKDFLPPCVAMLFGGDEIIPELGTLKIFKNNMNKEQYFVFLTALLKQRIFEQHVVVENNGKLNLSNVKIKILMPYIYGFESTVWKLYSANAIKRYAISRTKDGIELSSPGLNVGEKIDYMIYVRGNRLLKKDMLLSYDKIIKINYYAFAIYFLSILSALIILSGLFQYSKNINSKYK